MVEPFLGEIRMFGGNFAPVNWTRCYGQLLTVVEYQALYSIVGTAYGGDGRASFGLPDLRGRIPVHQGNGPGLTPRARGQRYGTETVTLTEDQIPSHRHPIQATTDGPSSNIPAARVLATPTDGTVLYTNPQTAPSPTLVELADVAVNKAGDGEAHGNMMPSMCITFIIALQGVFPSRN